MAYVYRHIRHDKNEPFYIGIGSDKYYKRAKNKKERNPIWKRIASRTSYDVEIIFDELSVDEAKKKEVEFIELYGRLNIKTGPLANITGGGEGMYNPPTYIRKRLSKASTGPNNKFYGKKHTEETRRKWSEDRKGVKRGSMPEETKKKIGQRHKGKPTWIKGNKCPKGALARSGKNHSTYKGEVCAYDVQMNLIKIFDCIADAARYFKLFGTNHIRRVISRERQHVKGIVFRYKHDLDLTPPIVKKIVETQTKMVLNTETGIFYDSIKDACTAHGIPHRNLARYLNGTRTNKTSMIFI